MEPNTTSSITATSHLVPAHKRRPDLRQRVVEFAIAIIANLQQMTERDIAGKFSGCGWGDATERSLTAAIIGGAKGKG